jgi:hypothetical protein
MEAYVHSTSYSSAGSSLRDPVSTCGVRHTSSVSRLSCYNDLADLTRNTRQLQIEPIKDLIGIDVIQPRRQLDRNHRSSLYGTGVQCSSPSCKYGPISIIDDIQPLTKNNNNSRSSLEDQGTLKLQRKTVMVDDPGVSDIIRAQPLKSRYFYFPYCTSLVPLISSTYLFISIYGLDNSCVWALEHVHASSRTILKCCVDARCSSLTSKGTKLALS